MASRWLTHAALVAALSLGAIVCPAIAQETGEGLEVAQPYAPQIITVKSGDDIPCSPDWPAGNLAEVGVAMPDRNGRIDIAVLMREVVYRVKVQEMVQLDIPPEAAGASFVDLAFYYSAKNDKLPESLRERIDDELFYATPIATRVCPLSVSPNGEVPVYKPIFKLGNKASPVSTGKVVTVMRYIFLQTAAAAPPAPEPAQLRLESNRGADHNLWSSVRPYAWTDNLDFTPSAQGETVLALNQVTCGADGNFIIASTGTVVGIPSTSTGRYQVRRDEMIAVNNYVSKNYKAQNREKVTADVDASHYWCIPKKEFCHEKIAFGDFSIAGKSGDVSEFPKGSIFSLRLGLVPALQRVVSERCLKEQ